MEGPSPVPHLGAGAETGHSSTAEGCGLESSVGHTPRLSSLPGGGRTRVEGSGSAVPPVPRRGEGSARRLCLPWKWGPAPSKVGNGQASPPSRLWGPSARVRRRPESGRCTRGGGASGGEAGRRNPTTKLASPSARRDLNGRSPRSAAERLESAFGRRGAAWRGDAAGRGFGAGRGAAGGGRGVGPSRAADADSPPGADRRVGAAASRPSERGKAGRAGGSPGVRPRRGRLWRGLCSAPAGGWSQPGPSRRAHLERI